LYFAATSGVCLIRSGAAGFPKKLHSKKKPAACFVLASFFVHVGWAWGGSLSEMENGARCGG